MENSGSRLGQYLEYKELTPYWLETELGLTNGRIRKSIERNSELKKQVVDLILKKLPNLSRSWLEDGNLPMEIETSEPKGHFEEKDVEKEYWKTLGKIEVLEDQLTEYKTNEARLKSKISELLDENNRLFNEIKRLREGLEGDQTIKINK